jgi:hypothetical protein
VQYLSKFNSRFKATFEELIIQIISNSSDAKPLLNIYNWLYETKIKHFLCEVRVNNGNLRRTFENVLIYKLYFLFNFDHYVLNSILGLNL